MATIFFWAFMAVVSVFVFRDRNDAAWNNITGYKKVDGKMVQTMYPSYYTFPIVLLAYWGAACTITLVLYFSTAFILEISGLTEKYAIQTLFNCIPTIF